MAGGECIYRPDGEPSLVAIKRVECSLFVHSELDVRKLSTPTQQR